MSSTANAASVGQIRSGLRALGESLRRGRRKVCPVLGLIEIETASKSLFSLSVQNVSVCAKSNVGTLVAFDQRRHIILFLQIEKHNILFLKFEFLEFCKWLTKQGIR